MRDLLELGGLIIIPAATAAAVATALRLCSPGIAARYGWGIATAVGFLVGSLAYPDRVPLAPERHWHWLIYAGIVAALAGAVTVVGTWKSWQLLPLYLLLGCLVCWPLTPDWSSLVPVRLILAPVLALYFAGLTWLLSLLPARLRGPWFVALLTLVGVATAVLVVAEASSLRIGTFLLRIPAALIGMQLAMRWLKGPEQADLAKGILALLPVYVVLVGGGAMFGAIEITGSQFLFLVAPAAPLTLWLFVWTPLARLTGWKALAAQTAVVLLVPIAVFLWLFMQHEPDEWGQYVIESSQRQF